MCPRRSTPSIALLFALSACTAALAQRVPEGLSLEPSLRLDAAANLASRPLATAALPESDSLYAAWRAFNARLGGGWTAHVDARTGVPSLVTGPGIAWFDPAGPLPSCERIEQIARGFLAEHPLLNVPQDQLVFEPSSCRPSTGGALRVWFTQRVGPARVQGALFAFDVVGGRMVAFGGERLVRVWRGVEAAITAERARAIALVHARRAPGTVSEPAAPELRLIPVDPRGDGAREWTGIRGTGLSHRLIWHVTLNTPEDNMDWSADIDADTGEVAAFRLDTQFGYLTGDVYPHSNDGVGWEGTRQPGFPMPSMYVRQNGAVVGVTDRGGYAPCAQWGIQTALNFKGPYWEIRNACGQAFETAMCPVSLDLGGVDGTNCDVPAGHGIGDDNAARTTFYVLNRAAEKGRYYFPFDSWYSTPQSAFINEPGQPCNGAISDDGLHYGVAVFDEQGALVCRSLSENESVLLHEWGHGVAWHDGAPPDTPAEAESDSVPLVETRASCTSRGLRDDTSWCGQCSDQCLVCTGYRDHDWTQLASQAPWTWRNLCGGSGGPCGKNAYDEGAILNQALFDMAVRDFPAMGMDGASAWQLLDRLYFQSRLNSTGNAYNCAYGVSTDGCGTNSWFHKFLVADDLDGNLANGTPHAAAIFAAFNRHEIACGSASDESNQNSSNCPAVGRPEITVSEQNGNAFVHWYGTSWATGYRVLATDNGCQHGQTVVAVTDTPDWTDATLTPGIRRYYRVQAVNGNCESAVSNCTFQAPDADNDGWSSEQDCNDADPTVFPHAGEMCDGKDNDCDSTIDEGLPLHTYYFDLDRDGHGVPTKTISACAVPDQYSALADDCNDIDALTYPGAPELCDSLDNNCDGVIAGAESDRDSDGWLECAPFRHWAIGVLGGGDCNDYDDWTYPGAAERCDGTDNNCDGAVPLDEGDHDGDGYVECAGWDDYHQAFPLIAGGSDCDDANSATHPGAVEICDHKDNNCDGILPGNETDPDGDHYLACSPYVGSEHGYSGGDCGPISPAVHPGAFEMCDHVDNDCDGVVDSPATHVPFAMSVVSSADFGRAVAPLGDVNGDGVPDFAVGRSRTALNGSVVVYSGATRSMLCETAVAPTASYLGTTVVGLPDIDLDSVPDFAAGAPGYDTPAGAVDAGAVMVFSGADCHLIRTCTPGAAGDRVGDLQGLAALGKTILAGAPYHDNGATSDAGAVFAVSPSHCGVQFTLLDAAAVAGDHLGSAATAIGDITGDGTPDIAAGAPDYDARGTDRGEALLYSGSTGSFIAYVRTGSPTEGGRFASSLAPIGDLDGDGRGELIVGERGANTGAGNGTGRVTVWSPEDQSMLRMIDGTAAQDQLGYAVAAIADRNGDGTPDIAAGAPFADVGGVTDAGRIDVFSGRTGALVRSFSASTTGASAKTGTSVAELGDVNHDLAPELLAGAPGQNAALIFGTESDCDADTWAPSGGDCNDANGAVHPGAMELCNGADENCDGSIDEGATGPGYTTGLALAPDKDTLTWPAQPAAESYDAQKGDLSVLLQNGGNFTPTVMACIANNLAATSVVDHDRPRPGKGLYYVYRAIGCGGQAGTYDNGGGQKGVRDAEIGASANACP